MIKLNKRKKKKVHKIEIDPALLENCKVIERNLEWEPQDDTVFDYIPPVEIVTNTDRHVADEDYVDKIDTPTEKPDKEGFEDWKEVWSEHVFVRLNKPPQGEAKDKTPGAKAKPSPWDMPDKGFGDVFDRRSGVWVGGRDKFDAPIRDGRDAEWWKYSKPKRKDEDSE